jgi:ABC-type phosphate/phosphonate transport system substrate-binding protein
MLRFGISRSHGGPTLLSGAHVFADELAERMQVRCKLVVADDYEHLSTGVGSGGVDVAWMPPLVHARAVRSGALLAAVAERSGAVTYRSAILTRADAPYLNERALAGARAAWADRSSAAGYAFARLHLVAAGVDPDRALKSQTFHGSAAAACAAVADGNADFCACFVSEAAADDPARALADVERVYAPARWRLRVLALTDAIPPDGVVLGAHVDGATQAHARDALLRMHATRRGAEGLRALMQADRLVPVTEAVRRILKKLDQVLR